MEKIVNFIIKIFGSLIGLRYGKHLIVLYYYLYLKYLIGWKIVKLDGLINLHIG